MNENPLLTIVQELRSKELNSLDQLPAINNKLNLLIINCLYSFLCLLRNLEQSHLDSPDGKPDMSRIRQPQLSIISGMIRDDIGVIKEFIDITYKDYVQNNKKLVTIHYEPNTKELSILFTYVIRIDTIVSFYLRKHSHPFATETHKRIDDIVMFYSQIIEKIIGIPDITKGEDLSKILININLEEEELSIRTGLASILDSIEKFIKIFNNHICISKVE